MVWLLPCIVLIAAVSNGDAGQSNTDLPNIVFMLTDDLGWNSPGFHNSDLHTPTLDALAANGAILDQHYVYKYCSPTRGSFLSGRFPYHLSGTRANLIPWYIPDGINITYTYLPRKLKEAGYKTHHIGKWHQGFYKFEYTPLGRGFDTSYGFLEGGEDHFTQKTFGKQCTGRDVDLWNNTAPAYGKNDTYNGYSFTNAAVDLINGHDPSEGPMFMYFALHNTHAPTEAPQRFIDLYDFPNDRLRATFDAMVSVVDEQVKNVTDALKAKGLWENTIFIWTTDNGSPVQVAGSNKPLRGGKGNNFEGGIRVPTFINGGLLPDSQRGKTLPGLMHVCDWWSTFVTMAGLTPADPNGPAPLESIDMWAYLSGKTDISPRTRIVHDHRMFYTNITTGALRDGDWKLIVGAKTGEIEASWFGQFSPNTTTQPDLKARACYLDTPCLFNITADPTEHIDLSSEHPDVLSKMMDWFNELKNTYHPPINNPPSDFDGYCDAIKAHKGFVAPWRS